MAGTTSDSTGLGAILKDEYETELGELINKSHPLLQKVKKSAKKFEGRRLAIAVNVGRNPSARGMTEGDYLPVAGNKSWVDAYVSAKKVAGRIQLTEDLIEASATKAGAFVEALGDEIDGLRESCEDTLHRQLYGNKVSISGAYPTGVITQVNGTVNNAAVVVDDNRWLTVGRTYRIGTAAELGGTGTPATGTVASKSGTTNVTFSAAVDVVDNDIIADGDSLGNSYDAEIHGLEHMVDDADDDYESVNTGTYTDWKALVHGNSGVGRALTLDLMHALFDTVADTNGSEPDFLLAHRSLRRKYIGLLQADVRFDAKQLDGGWTSLTYSNGSKPIPLEVDQKCTYGKIYMLNTKSIKLAERQPWRFMNKDGAILRAVANKADYEAAFTWSGNLFTTSRNKHGVLEDLNYSLTA